MAFADRLGVRGFIASSAGVNAMVAHQIHESAAAVLRTLGGDASGFSARQLTPRIAAPADLILTMTRDHRDKVLELAPTKLNRSFTLREASRLVTECGASSIADLSRQRPFLVGGGTIDIEDPIGQAAPVFAAVGAQIADLLFPVMELCRRETAFVSS